MENNIQIFNNPEFGEVRTLLINNEPYFVGKDVATVLGYKDTVNALKAHVDEDDKTGWQITTPSRGEQQVTVINESGLYSLIMSSKLPNAKKFKKWVTSDVLPSIRKHGGYLTPQKIEEILINPDTIINLATQLKEERLKRKEAERLNEINRPKVEFFDTVADSKTAVSMNEVAKCLDFAKMGRNNLFKFLRDKNVLMNNNLPYQQYIDGGQFRVIEQKYTGKDGMPQISYKTLVYQKGLDYIRQLLLKNGFTINTQINGRA